MRLAGLLDVFLLLAAPPFFLGVIAKTKALCAGRRGPSLWQPYWDLARLARKGAVYSRTTSWVFRLAPPVALAAALTAGLLVPLTGERATLAFAGDIILFAYLLGLARFALLAAALDTGSSFEGMGASREAAFASLVEPALLLALGVLAFAAHAFSLSAALAAPWSAGRLPALVLVAAALFIALLAENARLPVDDPATHLELTMVHEVMVLDHSGPDLAMLEYARAVKLFLFSALWLHALAPALAPNVSGNGLFGAAWLLLGAAATAALVGVLESSAARIRLQRVPAFLTSSWILAALALTIVLFLERDAF